MLVIAGMVVGLLLMLAAIFLSRRQIRLQGVEKTEVREPKARGLMLAGILVALGSLLVMLFVPGVYPEWDYATVTRTELLLVIVLFGVVYEWIMVDALA